MRSRHELRTRMHGLFINIVGENTARAPHLLAGATRDARQLTKTFKQAGWAAQSLTPTSREEIQEALEQIHTNQPSNEDDDLFICIYLALEAASQKGRAYLTPTIPTEEQPDHLISGKDFKTWLQTGLQPLAHRKIRLLLIFDAMRAPQSRRFDEQTLLAQQKLSIRAYQDIRAQVWLIRKLEIAIWYSCKQKLGRLAETQSKRGRPTCGLFASTLCNVIHNSYAGSLGDFKAEVSQRVKEASQTGQQPFSVHSPTILRTHIHFPPPPPTASQRAGNATWKQLQRIPPRVVTTGLTLAILLHLILVMETDYQWPTRLARNTQQAISKWHAVRSKPPTKTPQPRPARPTSPTLAAAPHTPPKPETNTLITTTKQPAPPNPAPAPTSAQTHIALPNPAPQEELPAEEPPPIPSETAPPINIATEQRVTTAPAPPKHKPPPQPQKEHYAKISFNKGVVYVPDSPEAINQWTQVALSLDIVGFGSLGNEKAVLLGDGTLICSNDKWEIIHNHKTYRMRLHHIESDRAVFYAEGHETASNTAVISL